MTQSISSASRQVAILNHNHLISSLHKELTSASILTCPICCEDKSSLEFTSCKQGHLVCRQCALSFIKTRLHMGTSSFTCIGHSSCSHPYSWEYLRLFLDPSQVQRAEHPPSQVKQNMTPSHDEDNTAQGKHRCPMCGLMSANKDDEHHTLTCTNKLCLSVTCQYCKKSAHLGECHNIAELMKKDYQDYVNEKMSEAVIRRCPGCHMPAIRDSGCNHITCSRCNAQACYVCLQLFTTKDGKTSCGCSHGAPKHETNDGLLRKNARLQATEEWKKNHPKYAHLIPQTPLPSSLHTIYIRTLTGKNLVMEEIDGETTVYGLKQMIQDREGIPPDLQRLIFRGKLMDDERTLADYEVQNEATIHLILRCGPGG